MAKPYVATSALWDVPMFFSNDVLCRVGRGLFALAYASECEERGIPFGTPGGEITEAVEIYPPDGTLIAIVCRYLGRVEQAWGFSLPLILHHMGITQEKFGCTEEEEEHILSDLLLGCIGHGVTLADDYDEELLQAGKILGRTFDPVPINTDDSEFFELVQQILDPQ